MRRRHVISGLVGAAAVPPSAVGAQQRDAAATTTVLIVGAVPGSLAPQGLRRGLQGLGYVEGRNIAIELYSGALAELPAELSRRRVDVIYAVASSGVAAAHRATRTVPIVAQDLETEPVVDGLIKSYSRPGGNLTGLFLDLPAMAGKWLQLTIEAVPSVSRVALLVDPALLAAPLRAVEAASRQMRVETREFELRLAVLDTVFRDIAAFAPSALIVLASPLVVPNGARIATLSLTARLPSIGPFRPYAEAGGFISYGPDPFAMGVRGAAFIDKIIRGISPSDLPVERPTKFELVVNLKTARALGLTLPFSLLAAADQIIE